MASNRSAPLVLHVHPDADMRGAARTARLIAAPGSAYRHAILPLAPGDRTWLPRGARVSWLSDFPSLGGVPTLGRLQRLASAMMPYALVVTHGYGAINAVMARTAFSQAYRPPPIIHHEWSHKPAITSWERRKRNWYRRIALGKVAALVVDTEAVERRALVDWQQPLARVKLIADGIDVRAFANRPRADALPTLVKRPGEWWLGVVDWGGTLTGLEAALVMLAELPERCHLVWATGFDRSEAIGDAADALALNHRVHNLADLPDLARFVGLFDALLVPSAEGGREAVLAAMASALPVVGEGARDVSDLLHERNHDVLRAPVAEQVRGLLRQPALAREVGEANRQRALAEFDDALALDTYRRLFDSALALPRA